MQLTTKALYDTVVARYSSPATAALGRLLLPYLFPELSAFATVEDVVSHLCTSDARYRAASPAEFLVRDQPSMFITLYFIVTRLPDSLRSVRDHFLSLDPIVLTIDLLEQHLLAAETSAVAVGAACGTPCTPIFEGCSPSPLAPSYASAAAVNVPGAEDVGAASASAKRRSSKGKGGRGGGGGSGGGGGGSSGGGGGNGGGGGGGSGGGSGGFGGGSGGSSGNGGSGSGGTGGGRTGAQRGGFGAGQRQRQQRRSETPSPQQLREWLFQRGASGGCGSCPYVIRTGDRAGRTCGKPHTQHRYFSRLNDAWHAEFGDQVEHPLWAELLRFGAAALGPSESSLPGTAPTEALHTFTLDPGASRCFFHHTSRSDWLTPPGAQSLPLPPLFFRVRRFRQAHCEVFTSSRSLRTWSGSTPLLVSPPIAPDSSVAPPPGSPLLASPAWHALPPPCLWSSQVSASPPALACPALPSLRRGAAACRSSLLLISPDVCSPADSPHGCSGEFSSDLLRDFCLGEGILQSFTLSDSPKQNGIAESRIGLVMEVARISMIHASAPHFLWPFAVQYAAHQPNLWPMSPCQRPRPHCVGRGRLAMRRCSRFGALVPLFAIRPRTSSPPKLSRASSLAFPLTRLAGSFTTRPRAVW
ncbi:unnamed protein product [Closterium sp. NIES-53]